MVGTPCYRLHLRSLHNFENENSRQENGTRERDLYMVECNFHVHSDSMSIHGNEAENHSATRATISLMIGLAQEADRHCYSATFSLRIGSDNGSPHSCIIVTK